MPTSTVTIPKHAGRISGRRLANRLWALAGCLGLLNGNALAAPSPAEPLSPVAAALAPGEQILYLACERENQILALDLATSSITSRWTVPAAPSGLALSPDGKRLYVTCAAPESRVCVLDPAQGKIIQSWTAGHTAMAPVLSPDGSALYICERFNDAVAVYDTANGTLKRRVKVLREPVAAALTVDGRWLLVGNHLHNGRADVETVTASVSVIDTTEREAIRHLSLPNGSGLLRGIAVSPDGRIAAVTHQISRFHLPTTQIERGWINNNALTLIDLASMKPINTVLLDNIDRGAANPWAAAWSKDGQRIVVTHAGLHEISVIDAPALLAKLAQLPEKADGKSKPDYTVASHIAADVPNDLSFLVGLRQRISLTESDLGPRALVLADAFAYVANYFSGTVTRLDLPPSSRPVVSIPLSDAGTPSLARQGERWFNDATICFQGWQSCASCHSSDARVDGLNWDNLNDGIGNPKNVKSLLLAHQTPPSMALGVRENAEVAVRAGIRHSLFTVQPEEIPAAMDAYLKSLQPIPSPYRVNDQLSPAALRGRELFLSSSTGCVDCHQPPLFVDLKRHDVGTLGRYDQPQDKFDTPTLVELWRTAPYLHDGSAPTLRDVLITRNPEGKHGEASSLSPEQLDDLIAYVLSL